MCYNAVKKKNEFPFCGVSTLPDTFLLIMKLLILLLSLPANPGIYEAISGNFLDSYSLSLLNPYMVRVFCI